MNFPPTRLSVIARTRSADEEMRRLAFATIIEAYWKPVYKYLRLKWQLDPDQAADLTQAFFATTLERDVLGRFEPERARFRTYLRLCVDGFASNARKAERRLKRGGGIPMTSLDFESAEGEMVRYEPAVPADVEELFYQEWVRALFQRSVGDLRAWRRARVATPCWPCSSATTLLTRRTTVRPTPRWHTIWPSRRRR